MLAELSKPPQCTARPSTSSGRAEEGRSAVAVLARIVLPALRAALLLALRTALLAALLAALLIDPAALRLLPRGIQPLVLLRVLAGLWVLAAGAAALLSAQLAALRLLATRQRVLRLL